MACLESPTSLYTRTERRKACMGHVCTSVYSIHLDFIGAQAMEEVGFCFRPADSRTSQRLVLGAEGDLSERYQTAPAKILNVVASVPLDPILLPGLDNAEFYSPSRVSQIANHLHLKSTSNCFLISYMPRRNRVVRHHGGQRRAAPKDSDRGRYAGP